MSALKDVGAILAASLEKWAKESVEAVESFERTRYGKGYADGFRDATQMNEGLMDQAGAVEEINNLIDEVIELDATDGSVIMNQAGLVSRLWLIRAYVADGDF